MIPMLKANAYGLGVREVVSALEPSDPWAYGVATVEEGLEMRALGVERPVVVFSPAPRGSIGSAVEAELSLSVGDLETMRLLADTADRAGRVARVHLEVDTGMGRSGVPWAIGASWLHEFRTAAGDSVRWVGMYTHLHSAETDPASVRTQLDRFSTWTRALGSEERSTVLCHTLNSAGILRSPERAGDAVRPGIFLYGGGSAPDLPGPRPVVSLRARVVHVRDAGPGSTVGYGATHRAEGNERWATLAIGYGDGFPRALGNSGRALIQGTPVPIVGRVSMDVTVVNITGVDGVGVGDVATLIGRDGAAEITLDEVADHAGTISYEILTGFSSRLPRVWEWADGG